MLRSPSSSSSVASNASASSPSSSSSASSDYGSKNITAFGSFCLLFNNLSGSAIVLFPSLYQQAGWLTCTAALLLIALLSLVTAAMLIEAMALVPGNRRFSKRVEYASMAKYYCPGRVHYSLIQIFYQLSLLCTNLTLIIQSCQVMDWTIVALFKRKCAFPQFYPQFLFICSAAVQTAEDLNTPFPPHTYVLSVGFIVVALLVLPLGFFNLDDNIIFQKVAFVGVALIVLIWEYLFIDNGIDFSRVPVVASRQSQVLGTVIFNFAILTSIPSWINEKAENVSAMRALVSSMFSCAFMFAMLGYSGGVAFRPWFHDAGDAANDTILDKIHALPSHLAHVTYFIFPIVLNFTSIPVFSILMRYNLLENKVCGKWMSNVISIIIPWLLVIPFYNGRGFISLVNYVGVFLISIVNFIIPAYLFILAVKREREEKEKLQTIQNERAYFAEEIEPVPPSPRVSPVGKRLISGNQLNGLSEGLLKAEEDNGREKELGVSALVDAGDEILEDAERVNDESIAVWSIFPQRYKHWRLPCAYAMIALMSVVCVVSIIYTIIAP